MLLDKVLVRQAVVVDHCEEPIIESGECLDEPAREP
jgi:hypothetical protein